MIKRFKRNERGRDFLISDIHGCFDQLEAALKQHGFNPDDDRCFAVGDLIDRGPRSPAALDWLDRPWFHTCMGNHEEMLLSAQTDEPIRLSWLYMNGGAWWLEVDAATRSRFLQVVDRLPLALEVETPFGCVGIVHADVPAGLSWPAFIQALAAGDTDARETALWSRARVEQRVTTPVAGIDRVVCGHSITPDRRIHRKGNVWFIDTGAFTPESGGSLTVLPIDMLFSTTGAQRA